MPTENEIKKIAHISRITVTAGELHALESGMNEITAYISSLDSTSDSTLHTIKQFNHHDKENIYRQDSAINYQQQALILQQAPAVINNLFSVPPLIER